MMPGRICKNPRRALIERDFICWRNPQEIVSEYGLPSFSMMYRHAQAMGLLARRNENVRNALGDIGETGEGADIAGEAAVRAARAYGCVSRDGEWTELPECVIYESRRAARQELVNAVDRPVSVVGSSRGPKPTEFLIANARLENAAGR